MLEPADHHILALQGFDKHPVLNGLLQRTLHPRVFRTHILCQLTHLTDVDLTDSNEHRNDSHRDKCQQRIHRKEITESAYEHGQDRQRIGNGLREEVDDIGDIKLQAVEHVTRMVPLPAMPPAYQRSHLRCRYRLSPVRNAGSSDRTAPCSLYLPFLLLSAVRVSSDTALHKVSPPESRSLTFRSRAHAP